MEILYILIVGILMLDAVLSDVYVSSDLERGWKLSFWMGMLFIFSWMVVCATHSSSTDFVLITCGLHLYYRWFCTRPADYYGVVWPWMIEVMEKQRILVGLDGRQMPIDYKAKVKEKLKEIFRK